MQIAIKLNRGLILPITGTPWTASAGSDYSVYRSIRYGTGTPIASSCLIHGMFLSTSVHTLFILYSGYCFCVVNLCKPCLRPIGDKIRT